MGKKEPDEKTRLTEEAHELNGRARAAEERLSALRARLDKADDDISEAAARGESTDSLEAELVSLPSAIRAAEAAVRGIGRAQAEVSGRLSAINRAERLEGLRAQQHDMAGRDEKSAAALEEALRNLGRTIVARCELVDESHALAAGFKAFDIHVAGARPWHELSGEVNAKVQREAGARYATVHVAVPIGA